MLNSRFEFRFLNSGFVVPLIDGERVGLGILRNIQIKPRSFPLPFLAFPRKPFSSAIDVLLAKTAASGFPDVMVGAGTSYPLILKLGAGASIGPKGSFKSSGLLEAHSNGGRYTANGQVQERDILAWTSISAPILFWAGRRSAIA